MEILDNMPHDRLFFDGERYSTQSVIQIETNKKGEEIKIEELREPVNDRLVLDFLKYLETMPKEDHISATKKLKVSGIIKRIKDLWDDFRHRDDITSNIFAPTAAIFMF